MAQYASADQSPRKAARTADPLAAVLAAGARVAGRTTTEELHLGCACLLPPEAVRYVGLVQLCLCHLQACRTWQLRRGAPSYSRSS